MFRRGLKSCIIFCIAVVDNIIFIPVYLLTVLLLRPWRNIVPKIYWTVESCIFRELMFTVAHWSWLSGVKILEFGDNPEDYIAERCLVIVNHISTADVLTLFACLCPKFPCGGQLLWIQAKVFKWTHFGIVGQLHGDFFIEEGRERRYDQSDLLRSHLERKYWSRGRNWVMLFPEGGFYRDRIVANREFAAKNGYPMLNYVTLPRSIALKAVLDTCRSYKVDDEFDRQVRYLIDVTIIYEKFDQPPDLVDFVTGLKASMTIRVVYKVHPASLLPFDEEPLRQRMYQIFEEKERLLKSFYESCQIDGSPDDQLGRPVVFGYGRFFIQRVVFFSLGYFYYTALKFLIVLFFGLFF